MKDVEELVGILKEMTTALSLQNRKEFAVSYQFLPLCFRECFKSKFPVFLNVVFGEETVDEPSLASPTLRHSPRKHSSSSKSIPPHSPRPVRAPCREVLKKCSVRLNRAHAGFVFAASY